MLESTVIENEAEEVESIWNRLETELEGEGIERHEIENNKAYIFGWVQKALNAGELEEKPPADATEDDYECQSRSPSPANEISTRSRLDALVIRINSRGQEDARRSSAPSDLTSAKDEAGEVRPPSSLSHRSQESTWRPFSGPNEAWVQRRLLRLAADAGEDPLILRLDIDL